MSPYPKEKLTTSTSQHYDAGLWRINVDHHFKEEIDKWSICLFRKDKMTQKSIEKYHLYAFSNNDVVVSFIPWLEEIATLTPDHSGFYLEVLARLDKLFPQLIETQLSQQIDPIKPYLE